MKINMNPGAVGRVFQRVLKHKNPYLEVSRTPRPFKTLIYTRILMRGEGCPGTAPARWRCPTPSSPAAGPARRAPARRLLASRSRAPPGGPERSPAPPGGGGRRPGGEEGGGRALRRPGPAAPPPPRWRQTPSARRAAWRAARRRGPGASCLLRISPGSPEVSVAAHQVPPSSFLYFVVWRFWWGFFVCLLVSLFVAHTSMCCRSGRACSIVQSHL